MIASTAAFADSAPTESQFLESCYAVCQIVQQPIKSEYFMLYNWGTAQSSIRRAADLQTSLQQGNIFDESLVRDFLSARSEAELQKQHLPFPLPGLTEMETAALIQYSGVTYRTINPALRSQASPEILVYRDFLNATLDKLPPFEGHVTRGMTPFAGWQNIYKKGSVVREKAFTSSSTGKIDMNENRFIDGMLLRIHSKTGRDISAASMIAYEHEVLFKAGTCFLITKVEQKPSARLHIVVSAEEVPCTDTP